MALNLAPFGRWTLRDKAVQRRLALRNARNPSTFLSEIALIEKHLAALPARLRQFREQSYASLRWRR